MADEVVGFNDSDADALIRMIDATGNLPPKPDKERDETSKRLAFATSGVSARSGTTLGSGTVAVKYIGFSGASRVILDAGYSVTAYNLSTIAVASNTYVQIGRLGDIWTVDWEECV